MSAPPERIGWARRVSSHPVARAWLLLTLVTSVPYVKAALDPPPGSVFVGTFHWIDDVYYYMSFAQQAEDGHFVFRNKLTTEPHRAALVNVEWWATGVLSRLLGRRPLLAFRIVGILAGLALLAGVDRWLVHAGLPVTHRLPALLLVGTAGAAYLYLEHLNDNITSVSVDGAGTGGFSKDKAINLLVIGTDKRTGSGNEGYGDSGSVGHADTTILLHVSKDRTNATALSIPRDLVVDIPDCPTVQKDGSEKIIRGTQNVRFNSSLGQDERDPGCTMRTVKEVTGISPDHFMMADFNAVKTLTTAVGGVEVCVTKAVNDILGDGVLMYQSDYPHPESLFPDGADTVLEWKSVLGEPATRKLMGENAMRFLRLASTPWDNAAEPVAAGAGSASGV